MADYRANGAKDARHERDHSVPLTADQARARAALRRGEDADYWEGYADEVESWEGQ